MSSGWGKRGQEIEFLHLYGQYSYHSEATIRGNRKGLEALRKAIDDALSGNTDATASVYSTDDEGYGIKVQHTEMVSGLGWPEYLFQLEYEMGKREADRARDLAKSMDRVRRREASNIKP